MNGPATRRKSRRCRPALASSSTTVPAAAHCCGRNRATVVCFARLELSRATDSSRRRESGLLRIDRHRAQSGRRCVAQADWVNLRSFFLTNHLDPRPIDGRQRPAKQTQLTAEQYELAADRAESIAIIGLKIGNAVTICWIYAPVSDAGAYIGGDPPKLRLPGSLQPCRGCNSLSSRQARFSGH